MATYYVDFTGGNDTSAGTATNTAWKTLTKVNATSLSAGDQVLFKSGETFPGNLVPANSGSSGSPITFGKYGSGALPKISGGNSINYGVVLESRSHITIDGLEVSGFTTQGVRIYQFSGTQTGITVKNSVISASGSAIYQSTSTGTTTNITISDNQITAGISNYGSGSAEQWGVYLSKNVNGFVVSGNTIAPAGEDAITVWFCQNGQLLNNTMGGNGENSIDVKDSSDIWIIGNTAVGDREYGIIVHEAGDPYTGQTGLTHNIRIEDNTITNGGIGGSLSFGLAVWENNNCIVKNNVISDCYGGGMFVRYGGDVTIIDNQLLGNGVSKPEPAMNIHDVTNLTLTNNIVDGQVSGNALVLDSDTYTESQYNNAFPITPNVLTIAQLKANMAPDVIGGISGQDMHDFIDTVEDRTSQETITKTADYTATLADNRRRILFNSSSATKLKLPSYLPQGWECRVLQMGTGAVTIEAVTGGTLVTRAANATTAGQYAQARVIVAANITGTAAQFLLRRD